MKASISTQRMHVAFSLSILMVLMAMSTMAMAQFSPSSGFDMFTPKPSDQSIVVMKEVIGDWTDEMSTLQPLFSEAMKVFNLGVLLFGTILFAYTAIIGSMASAHDGQVLGKQWSTMWVPARFSMAVFLLVPTAKGLCIAQLGMLWLLGQGVGLASSVWSSAVNGYVSNQQNLIAIRSAGEVEVRTALNSILANEMCVAVLNRGYDPANPMFGLNVDAVEPTTNKLIAKLGFDSNGGRLSWGGRPESGYAPDACGYVDVPDTTAAAWTHSNSVRDIMGTVQLNGLVAAAAYLRSIAEIATTIDAAVPPMGAAEVNEHLKAANATYRESVASQLADVIQTQNAALTNSMIASATTDGWFTAGSFIFQIARINKELNEIAGNTPTVHSSLWYDDVAGETIKYKDANYAGIAAGLPSEDAQRIRSVLAAGNAVFLENYYSSSATYNQPINVGSTETNVFKSGFNQLSHAVMGVSSSGGSGDIARFFGYDPNNPAPAIVQLKNVGDWFLTAAWTIAIGPTVVDKATSVLPTKKLLNAAKTVALNPLEKIFGNLKGASEIGLVLLSFIVIAVFSFGVILAYWLPMLPFINWIGGIIGWVTAAIEMLMVFPVWIASHFHPDGDGVASKHALNGYMLLLELLLRPVFMVFGLIAAIIMVDPLLNFIAGQFYPSFATVVEDTVTGPISWAMKIIMFAVLCWMSVNMTFKAINSVPNGAMQMLGGRHGSYSEMGESLGENARSIVVAGAHKMTGSVERISQRRQAASIRQQKEDVEDKT